MLLRANFAVASDEFVKAHVATILVFRQERLHVKGKVFHHNVQLVRLRAHGGRDGALKGDNGLDGMDFAQKHEAVPGNVVHRKGPAEIAHDATTCFRHVVSCGFFWRRMVLPVAKVGRLLLLLMERITAVQMQRRAPGSHDAMQDGLEKISPIVA